MKQKQNYLFMFTDIIAVNISYILAFYIKFDKLTHILDNKVLLLKYLFIITIIKLITFNYFKLYKSVWEFASIDELIEVVGATIVGNVLSVVFLIFVNAELPRTIYLVTPMIDMIFIGGIRFFYRIFRRVKYVILGLGDTKKVLIVGACAAGVMEIGRAHV